MAWSQETFAFDLLSEFAEAQALGGLREVEYRVRLDRIARKSAYDAVWKAEHSELVKAARDRWRVRHRGKQCSQCRQFKKRSEFRTAKHGNGPCKRTTCHECRRRYKREWMRKSREMQRNGGRREAA